MIDSFVPISVGFGRPIVSEGEAADAFYVLASGTARVVKAADDGNEISLNVLRPGDSFGEMALLEETTRTATVRSSSDVTVLRLDRSVFHALVHRHPEIRAHLELQIKHRHLHSFFRLYSPFARLPVEALKEGIISWLEYNNRRLEASKLQVELQQLERQVDTARLKVSQLKSDEQQQEIESRVLLDQLASERRQTQASIDKLRHEAAARRSAFSELERSLREDSTRATIRTAALRAELQQASGNELSVPSPCAGTVLRLWVQRPGAVVKEGEPLGDLACGRGPLQAELTMPASGVGQVEPGQPVKLLYDTFPYQRHGVRRATVRWVSPAAVEGNFRVFADVEDDAITVKGERRPLTAGMGGRADVVTGRRSLITYAFEPLRQLRESLADAPPSARPGATPR